MDTARRVFGLVASLLLLTTHALADSPAKPSNILLILSDDHSYPHLGCYGNTDIKTPHLDRLAAQGMRFDRAYVACPQCVPSRAAIMTGRSPVRIAMTRFTAPLPADVVTYPELLRKHGYFTGVAGRGYHLDGRDRTPELRAFYDRHELRTFDNRLDYVRQTGDRKEAFGQFREFLDQASGKPFFLQLCYSDPHRPLDRKAIPEPHDPASIKLPAHYPDTPAVRDDFARYYDEISRMDGCVGEVLAELDRRGLADTTLVAFMGDNGASQLRGKGTLNEFGIHVPLVIRWPGVVKAGSHSSALISAEDLAPTFLQAAGLDKTAEMTGRSFVKLLRGEPFEARRYVFAERGAHGGGLPANSAVFDLGRCVVGDRYKLIYNALWQLPYHPVDFGGDPFWKELEQFNADGKIAPHLSKIYFSSSRPMFELYDLQEDPHEFNNLAGDTIASAVEQELRQVLTEWMILERDFLPLPVVDGAARPATRTRK
jgi:arylsulfatase A-like enzyme